MHTVVSLHMNIISYGGHRLGSGVKGIRYVTGLGDPVSIVAHAGLPGKNPDNFLVVGNSMHLIDYENDLSSVWLSLVPCLFLVGSMITWRIRVLVSRLCSGTSLTSLIIAAM